MAALGEVVVLKTSSHVPTKSFDTIFENAKLSEFVFVLGVGSYVERQRQIRT